VHRSKTLTAGWYRLLEATEEVKTMPMYLVDHTHTAETCPTQNPDMVRQLAAHVTDEGAAKFGVKLLGDFVREQEHHVVLILEADSQDKVENFAQPFKNAGPVTIQSGGTCQDVARECLGQTI